MRHPYQALGSAAAKMLGRGRLVKQLEGHVLKPSPEHVQLVGPQLFGNTLGLYDATGDARELTRCQKDRAVCGGPSNSARAVSSSCRSIAPSVS